MILSSKEFLLLGIVPNEEGISGKTLNKYIKERNVKVWADIGFSSIYYLLNQMEKKRYLKSEYEKSESLEGGAPQKLYKITKLGHKLLKQTVIDYFNKSNINYKDMNLALAASHVFSKNEFLKVLKECRKKLKLRLEEFDTQTTLQIKSLVSKGQEITFLLDAMFINYRSFIITEINFIENLIKKLETNHNLFSNISK